MYKELEQSGLIEARRRNGTVVVGPAAVPNANVGAGAALMAAVDCLIETARHAGVSDETLVDLLRGRLAQTSKLET